MQQNHGIADADAIVVVRGRHGIADADAIVVVRGRPVTVAKRYGIEYGVTGFTPGCDGCSSD